MPKAIIREDNTGKYLQVDGVVVRPIKTTSYDTEASVDVQNCASTIIYGVGKDEQCGRGEYAEAWYNTGATISDTKLNTSITHLHQQLLLDYPSTISEGRLSFTDIKKHHKTVINEGSSQIQQALKSFLDEGDYTLTDDDIQVMSRFDSEDEDLK